MSDLINRQAAIDALRAMQTYQMFAGDDLLLIDQASAQTELMMLPSTQSKTNCSEFPNNSDAISRQAAIDAADNTIPGDWFDMLYPKLEALPSAQPEQRWIPCSERLPERGKDVLVTRDYDGREDSNKSCRYVEVAGCFGEDDDISWCSLSDEYKMRPKNHHVIAWMPLPEPYGGDQNG